MPVLKIDPSTGASLDKEKTPEEITKEQAKIEKFYSDRKKRSKTKGKKKPLIKDEQIVIVNPFVANNADPAPEELIKQFNKLLEPCEEYIKNATKNYRITKPTKDDKDYELTLNKPKAALKVVYDSDYATNTHIPKEIEYVETNITSIPFDSEVFYLDVAKKKLSKRNLIVERVRFNTSDIKQMLQHPEETGKVLLDLTKKLLANFIKIKYLSPGNKYYGTVVASLKIPGKEKSYCNIYKDEYIEVRCYSDITEMIK